MPSPVQLVVIAIIAGVCALLVSLVFAALGYSQHIPVAAASSAASAAAVSAISIRRKPARARNR
ncbi:MAG TPA: hypothetical protein VK176_02290 [Phycisphaerales bacterium]|nr:hypothetical protein [Phycisphaerales bacterium]